MPPSGIDKILGILFSEGILSTPDPVITPLSGGVSCEVYKIDSGKKKFVLKWALEKLQTEDNWYADVKRNKTEQEYIHLGNKILPEHFPNIIYGSEDNFFLMDYLGDDYKTWKSDLMKGIIDENAAIMAGKILGTIHSSTFRNSSIQKHFDNKDDFFDLRVDSYILTTGKRHPELLPFFEEMASRLMNSDTCLMHGDFSPKNILVNESNMVIIDCETACFGDPIFDTGFLLNHLFLKSRFNPKKREEYMNLVRIFWNEYTSTFREIRREKIELETVRILPMLSLARIDGKSPVEYLKKKEEKVHVRKFAKTKILSPKSTLSEYISSWLLSFNL